MTGLSDERLAEIRERPCLGAEDLLAAYDEQRAAAERLTHLLGSHADGHRCSCELLDGGASGWQSPPEWEQDPWCLTHPDMDYIIAEVEWLREERAKTTKACQTLGKIVDRQAVDICRIADVPMPESGDADFELAWSRAFAMAEDVRRLRARVAAVEALADRCAAKAKRAKDAGELDARDWLRDFERVLRAALASADEADGTWQHAVTR